MEKLKSLEDVFADDANSQNISARYFVKDQKNGKFGIFDNGANCKKENGIRSFFPPEKCEPTQCSYSIETKKEADSDCERMNKNQTPEKPANNPNKFLPNDISIVSMPTRVEIKGISAKVNKLKPILGV